MKIPVKIQFPRFPNCFARVMMAIGLLASASLAPAASTLYTTSTTWTCPAGVTNVMVECWGGGGAGGNAINGGSGTGAGGGAGGTFASSVVAVVPGHVYTITVGAGGTTNSVPVSTAGGLSSFVNSGDSVAISAQGGAYGTSVNGTTTPNSGGTGASASSTGSILSAGGSGAAGTGTSGGGGGGSGGNTSPVGTAGNNGSGYTGGVAVTEGGTGGNGATNSNNGLPGAYPGGGGGGAFSKSGTQRYGGPGAAGAVVVTPLNATFTPGNLAVERLGNGVETLTSGGNTIYLDEYTTSGAAVQSVMVADSGSATLVESGVAKSGGGLTLSADGRLLCVPGYNVAQASSSSALTGTASSAVPRGIGTVNAAGTYTLATTSSSAFNDNNFRGAATDGNNNFWGSGNTGTGGIYYFGTASAAADVTNANLICVNDFNGNLWFDTQNSTPGYGLWKYAGAPTTATGNTLTQVISLSSSDSPYNFVVNNGTNPTVIYYADDGSGTGESSGNAGIHKWTKSGSTWSSAYILLSGTAVYGLAVDWTTTPATLYATTGSAVAGNTLISVQDSGSGATATTLATAAANTMFRNVTFTPVSPAAANNSPVAGAALSLSATTVPNATYSWTGPNSYTSTAQNPTVTSNAGGANNGTYTVTVSWDNGLYAASANTTVTIPAITGAATATAFTTTYGSASTAQSFAVSGANLTASLVATAPTGFEVSADGVTYGSTATFTESGGTASGTVHLRLKATATVSGSYNAQKVVLTSTGAANVNITTAASGNSVSPAALTITGLAGVNKIYDGTTSASITGTAAYAGLVNGESFSVSGTPSASFTSAGVANGKTVNVTGYAAPTANYSLTQPSLTANITAATLTYTASPASLAYGSTIPTLSGSVSGFVNGENQSGATTGTLTFTTTATSSSPVGSYAVTGSGLTAANYTFAQAAGNATALTIVQATPAFTLSASANPVGFKDNTLTFTAGGFATAATGTVQFITNGAGLGSAVTINNGSAASLAAGSLPRGTTNLVQAVYSGNANYLAWTNTLTETVTNHPPAASLLTVTRTAGLPLEIALAMVATNWTDADGDPVSLTAIHFTTTNGVALFPINLTTNQAGAYVTTGAYLGYANGASVGDQISYTINDGQGGTNAGYINIVIQTSVTGTNSIASLSVGNPNTLTAHGVPGFSYITERSTNLTAWVPVATNTAGTNGLLNILDRFSDLNSNAPAAAYYRLRWQP